MKQDTAKVKVYQLSKFKSGKYVWTGTILMDRNKIPTETDSYLYTTDINIVNSLNIK